LSRNSDRYGDEARFLRATTYVALHQLDSAAVELETLLASLHRREEAQLTHIYESKALLYYAMGLLQAARHDQTAARAALERALIEDLSFYPAHIALGQLLFGRDPAGSLRELEQAAAAGASDPDARYEYGAALVRAHRVPEGVAELRAAIGLEPYFADPYFWLGEGLLAQGDSGAALATFQAYVARCSAKAPQLITAGVRVAALQRSREE
jgi:tetratricopeptide (TPR) repeat protein